MKLHLIDGTYELFRQYYGMKDASAFKGIEVGATRGLLRTVLKLINNGATHLAIAFDTVIESFRNDLFDGYKTGDGIPAELWDQFPLAEEAMKAMGLVVWGMEEFEADDALATAATRWHNHKDLSQILLCSPDKDLAQCVVGDKVVLFDRRREKIINEPAVLEKFGIQPESMPDYLALVGDTADGIPGVPRWGAKSSATVLTRYVHLESIPKDPEEWDIKVRGAKALAEQLVENWDKALLYRQLATLRRDVPLEQNLEDLEWRGAYKDKLEAFCAKIGDTRFPERLSTWR